MTPESASTVLVWMPTVPQLYLHMQRGGVAELFSASAAPSLSSDLVAGADADSLVTRFGFAVAAALAVNTGGGGVGGVGCVAAADACTALSTDTSAANDKNPLCRAAADDQRR